MLDLKTMLRSKQDAAAGFKPRSLRAGFSLVEIMIVVSIIGLLAVIALPYARKARQESGNASFLNDLRLISSGAFEYYATDKGDYPPDAPPGVEPAGIHDYLPKRFDWTADTAIGGRWDWDRAVDRNSKLHGCYAGISIAEPDRTTVDMKKIDAKLDDGNLETGVFRRKPGGYIYILEF